MKKSKINTAGKNMKVSKKKSKKISASLCLCVKYFENNFKELVCD
jgi:hypothetical protein